MCELCIGPGGQISEQAFSERIRYWVSGLETAEDAAALYDDLLGVAGVVGVTLGDPEGTVTVTHDGAVSSAELVNAIRGFGYEVTLREELPSGAIALSASLRPQNVAPGALLREWLVRKLRLSFS